MMIVCPWGVVRVAEVSDCQLAGKDVSAASRVLAGGDEIEIHVTNPGRAFRVKASLTPGQTFGVILMEIISD